MWAGLRRPLQQQNVIAIFTLNEKEIDELLVKACTAGQINEGTHALIERTVC